MKAGKNWVLALLILLLAHPSGGNTPFSYPKTADGLNLPSEYVFRNDPEEILMPVFLLGAVRKPGLYHIPLKTDLVTLLTLSGGSTAEAELDRVIVKRKRDKRVTLVDLDELLSNAETESLGLRTDDVIYVKAREPSVSNNTLLTVGLISGIVGIVLSGVLISQQLKGD